MIFEQNSFKSGSDLISPDTQIKDDAYAWLVNGRNRYGYIEPVTTAFELPNVPVGKKQGVISIGTNVIVFVSGKAYYKKKDATRWVQIPNFQMSATANRIYSITVPASTRDYQRKLNASGDIADQIVQDSAARIGGTPSGIVCQDGVTQPKFIGYAESGGVFNARTLGTYAQWTVTTPEYVPIGLFMMYVSSKLFVVAADKQSVYQSVTGQPLNFMMNIKKDGSKEPLESVGGADSTSFAFDYDQITCLQPVNITDSFIYSTNKTTRVISLNYNFTIFGEPLFAERAKISSGIINQEALVEISGDYAMGNYEGLRTFNAVQQVQFEGRNTVFSRGIAKLLKDIRQTNIVAMSYDNYCLFSVDTVCGPALAVFDSMTSQWSAIDLLDIGKVKECAIVDLPADVRMYVITETDKLYQLYSASAVAKQPYVYTRAFSSNYANSSAGSQEFMTNSVPPVTEIKSQNVDLIFKQGTSNGTVYCTEFCDGISSKTLTKPIAEASVAVPYTLLPAIQPLIEPEGERITFNFKDAKRGFKLGYVISWDTDAVLMKLRVTTSDFSQTVANTQRNNVIASKQI